jgi:hypothetical protein
MKKQIFLTILSLVTIGYSFCQENDSIIGKVVSIDNPCTTEPCLPCGVIALQTDSISYILTINHIWNIDSFAINGRYIGVDDSIKVIGIIYEKVDLKDEVYYELEIQDVFFFDITAIEKNKTSRIEIFPNPTNGIVKIKNTDNQISSICLIDLNSKEIANVNGISSPIVEIDNISFKGIFICKVTLQNNQIITTKIVIK